MNTWVRSLIMSFHHPLIPVSYHACLTLALHVNHIGITVGYQVVGIRDWGLGIGERSAVIRGSVRSAIAGRGLQIRTAHRAERTGGDTHHAAATPARVDDGQVTALVLHDRACAADRARLACGARLADMQIDAKDGTHGRFYITGRLLAQPAERIQVRFALTRSLNPDMILVSAGQTPPLQVYRLEDRRRSHTEGSRLRFVFPPAYRPTGGPRCCES